MPLAEEYIAGDETFVARTLQSSLGIEQEDCKVLLKVLKPPTLPSPTRGEEFVSWEKTKKSDPSPLVGEVGWGDQARGLGRTSLSSWKIALDSSDLYGQPLWLPSASLNPKGRPQGPSLRVNSSLVSFCRIAFSAPHPACDTGEGLLSQGTFRATLRA